MIKIVSAYSYPIGPTLALVELCNLFNADACECTLYGPDNWHLDKCRSALLAEFLPANGDIVILHGLYLSSQSDLNKLPEFFATTKQSRWLHRLRNLMAGFTANFRKPDNFRIITTFHGYDDRRNSRSAINYCHKIHYACTEQLKNNRFQPISFVCPNPFARLKPSPGKPDKVAGIIGSIRKENNTASSIEKALNHGMETVIIYGYLQDPIYYYKKIEPLTRKYPGKIKFAGFIDNKQNMYDSISDVYCSINKPWSVVRQECNLTNTRFHGQYHYEDKSMTNDQILTIWKNELGL
jgi:hypothetical protein